MHRMRSTLNKKTPARWAGFAFVALAIFVAFAGCKDQTEALPATGTDYYPVAVGNFWVYAVTDTTWSAAAVGRTSVPTASVYRFKETITEAFTDAAGQKAYRMVRAKMGPVTTTWRDDSVFVVSATAQAVVVNRNNTRTVELTFPVKEGRSWNFNAYNNNYNDTIKAETRRSSAIGKPYTTGSTPTTPAVVYPATVTTMNTGAATENSLLKRISYQQVFAKGVGPVFRQRVHLAFFNYVDQNPGPNNGRQVYPANSYTSAFSRRETLVAYSLQ